jgi:uncharacterized protein YbaR (Trm112 family)
MIPHRLLKIIVCPKCKGELQHVKGEHEELICSTCAIAYPVIDDIPNMIIEDAGPLSD